MNMLQEQEYEKILHGTLKIDVDINEFERFKMLAKALQATPVLRKQNITPLREIYDGLENIRNLKKYLKHKEKQTKRELKKINRISRSEEREAKRQELNQDLEKLRELL